VANRPSSLFGSSEQTPCDACDGHGFWCEVGKPCKVERSEVCKGSGVLPDEEEVA
jgi:DnaJ-class molecular chaperone